jgi:PAS domain S-box-containing protein
MHRAKRLFIWMGCLVTIGCIWLICCYQIFHDRQQARLSAETTASNFAKAFEEHIRSTVIQIDSTLRTMRDDYVQHPEYFEQQLAIYKKNLYHDLIIQVSVIDANGIMVFNEQAMPKVPLNLSDREHFKVHRNSDKDLLFISKPVLGRVSKRWSIQFTRKILRRDGTFGGVMVISVDPAFFTSFFRSFDLGRYGVVSLVGMDHVVRARSVPSSHVETFPADRPFFRDRRGAGILHLKSVVDGIDRIYAYRRFHNYPLIVSVGLADEGIYGAVDSRRNILILLAAFLSALLLIGTKIIFFFDKEQSRIERSLREAKQRLELATASGHLAVWQWDVRSGALTWDSRMHQLYGTDPSSFSGHHADFHKIVHPEDLPAVLEAVKATMRGEQKEISIEFRIVRPEGTVRTIKGDGLVIRDSAGRAVRMIGLNRDITDIKQARQDMLKTQKLQSLGVLAGGIAHDFNNILTAIFTNVSLARVQVRDPEKAVQRLAEAEKAITRATDLTKQLLTFSRGGAPIKKIINVNELLREAGSFVLHGSKASGAFELAGELWSVEADEGQIAQVIHNLVLNAMQAMPDGGTVTIRSENAGTAESRFVKISVADTGGGVPQKILHEIFDPYFTTKAQGNGLGLATCYSIVQKHGGTIAVTSTEGKGTTFTVSLPASQRKAVSRAASQGEMLRGSGRILVMDDEPAIRDAAQAILEELDYAVEVAVDGASAVRLFLKARREGNPFSVVILDMTVPGGMGGKETMEKLMKIDPHVTAIVSSGYSNDTVMANFREYGFRAVLVKPYLPQQLSEVLSEVTAPQEKQVVGQSSA